MTINWDTLHDWNRKRPGFLSACERKGQASSNGLRISREDYAACRQAFGLSAGLGDTVAKITGALGVKECAGCKKRRAKLNKLVPY